LTKPNQKKLFKPLTIKNKVLKNRIFSTGHMAVMLKEGCPTDDLIAYHEAKAKGGAALTIIEAARVHPSGNSERAAIRAYDPKCIPGYKKLVAACHRYDCLVFGQLTHPGREMGNLEDGTNPVAYAPSAIPNERFHIMPREMSETMIHEIVMGFKISAQNLKTAGLDGIEIVASHGYLLGQFLNKNINRRKDKYGGNSKNRFRILNEIIDAVKLGSDDEMLIGIRLSGDEKEFRGIELQETLKVVEKLNKNKKIDYINITAGTSAGLAGSTHIVPSMRFEAGYTLPLSKAIKCVTSKPIFVAGRINTPQMAEEALMNKAADMCGMTRAIISDPQMPQKAERGQLDEITACVGCNQACIGHMLNGQPISCIQRPETGRELTFGKLKPASKKRKILIIGGGPAGMKAATVAASRGHTVKLIEASSKLGGQVNLAQRLPGRSEFGGITTNLANKLHKQNVEIKFKTNASIEFVIQEAPEVVILATGGRSFEPKIEGKENAHVVTARQILEGKANVGSRVAIADWRCDWVGLGLAELLARQGCHVRLACNGMVPGQTINQYVRDNWLGTLHKLNVETFTHLRLRGIDSEDAFFQHTLSGEPVILDDVDTLVTAFGAESANTLEAELKNKFRSGLYVIGDALSPRTVEEAIFDGLKTSTQI
jgi:2,4-dienoyl-CoA reductase-like NADH-dependent reductase (Old Yellow Enzyme family)